MKKYELVKSDTRSVNRAGFRHQVYRIRALVDIPRHNVYAGEYGGWIESEENLSHEGDAWISEYGIVSGRSKVYGHALVKGEAIVLGESEIYERAIVSVNAVVIDSCITDDVHLTASAYIKGCHLESNLVVRGNVEMYDCNIHGTDSYIVDEAVLKDVRMTIVKSTIKDNCRLLDCSLGSTLYKLMSLSVSGNALLERVRNIMPVSNLTFRDNAHLKNVTLSGKNISVLDMATLSGNVKLEDCSLEDMACISVDKEKLTLMMVQLSGDVQITDTNIREFTE